MNQTAPATKTWATFRWLRLRCAGFVLLLPLGGCNGAASPTDLGGAPSVTPTVAAHCAEDNDCDDGRACNGVETCEAGACALGEPVDCNDGVSCTFDSCDQSTGKCSHTAPDDDGDGSLDAACQDEDGRALGDDCDDLDAHRYPGNPEVCGVGTADEDEDCDAKTFGDLDLDDDGYVDSACFNTADDGDIFRGEDCDDGARSVHPGTSEVCDGFDNNCDGEVDEGLLVVGYKDKDGDGYGVPVTAEDAVPGEVFDDDGLLHVCPGTPQFAELSIDCDDTDALVRPNLFELCDLVDNDCDEEIDENPTVQTWYWDGDDDGFGVMGGGGPIKVSCERQAGYSLYPEDCDDTSALSSPIQFEICDGKDNDCDGSADYYVGAGNTEDDDEDGSADPFCNSPSPDCDEDDAYTYPGARELCDGKDNDCNGATDTQVQTLLWYLDEDGDGWGSPLSPPIDNCDLVDGRVTKTGDCDDRDPTRSPGLADDCNGVAGWDDDCDGEVDEAETSTAFFRDQDGDGYGKLGSAPLFACQVPAGWTAVSADCDDQDEDVSPASAEDCSLGDGQDDDCDGKVDCADADCQSAPDCEGFFRLALQSPALPLTAVVATPFAATVSVKTATGDPVPFYDVSVICLDGAYSPTSGVSTDADGLVELVIYPGLALGDYECAVTGSTTVPLSLEFQAIGPTPGTVHTTFNAIPGPGASPQDGGSSLGGYISSALALEVDADGTAYLADGLKVYGVSPRGVTSDLGAALGANFQGIADLALDRDAQILYLLDSNPEETILALDLAAQSLTLVAGGGTLAFAEGMSALDFNFSPHHVVVDPVLGLTVLDSSGPIQVKPDGTLSRWNKNSSSDKPKLTDCNSYNCRAAISEAGNLLLTGSFDLPVSYGNILARISPDVELPTQLTFNTGIGNDLPLSALNIGLSKGLAFDNDGNLLFAHDNRIRWIGKTELIARDLIGGASAGQSGDYGPSTSALVQNLTDVAVDASGSVWFLENGIPSRVRRIWKPNAPFVTTAVNLSLVSALPTGWPGYRATAVQVEAKNQALSAAVGVPVYFDSPDAKFKRQGPATTSGTGLATSSLWTSTLPEQYDFTAVIEDLTGAVAASVEFSIDVQAPAGSITSITNPTHAGGSTVENSSWAPGASSGPTPYGVAAHSSGAVYFGAGFSGGRVLRLDPGGALVVVAGGGALAPENVPALSASLSYPYGVALDEPLGRLFITADSRIYSLALSSQLISTVTGQGTTNVGPAANWSVDEVYSLAVSSDGSKLYFASSSPTSALCQIDLSQNPPTRSILVAAPVGPNCVGLPDGPFPTGYWDSLGFGSDGFLYVAGQVCHSEQETNYLYKLDPDDPAGTFTLLVPLQNLRGVGLAVDDSGRVYMPSGSSQVTRWDPQLGLQLVAGTGGLGGGTLGDQGPAIAAQLNSPNGVALTAEGDLLIADESSVSIRKVWSP